jgi:hypothetical protein
MEAGALILQKNSGHNVLALKKKAPQDLVTTATRGFNQDTHKADRPDDSRPTYERTAAGCYQQPSLFALPEASKNPGFPCAIPGKEYNTL